MWYAYSLKLVSIWDVWIVYSNQNVKIDRIVEYATKCIYHLDLSGCRNIYLLQHVPEEVW